MEESRGISSSPATGMAEEPEAITHEAVRDSSKEWFISILHVDDQQFDPEARSKHPIYIQKAPTKFRNYKLAKKYFDPQVVSLGPYHHGEDHLKPMEKHKITVAKQFVDEFICETEREESIYKKFRELTEELKGCYDAEVSEDVFARMMFLDGCFVLHFIDKISEGAETILKTSTDLIPLIIRDMFLIENQLPFEVLDALMNLRWGSSSTGKKNILRFIEWKVFIPMGFWPEKYSWLLNSRVRLDLLAAVDQPLDQRPFDRPLHLLDILRNILLDFTPSNGSGKQSNKPHYFGSVMELKEFGIKFEKRRMKSLMDISYKENLLFPQLLLPTMFINDTTISQLLNLTAFEAFSYSGCGVTSYIHFMDSLINDDADVKMLRSKGILHHSLGSDDEVARLFNTWPGDVRKDLKLYSDISNKICWHGRTRTVKISIATWLDKYFGSPWTAISFVAAALILFFTAIQTYFAAFS